MKNKLNIKHVKSVIESFGYELVGEYSGNGFPITIKDKNGLYYFPIYSNVTRGLKPEVIGVSNPYSFKNMEIILNSKGKTIFHVLNKKYIDSFQRIFLIDDDGYKYEINWPSIRDGHLLRKFNPTNRYTIKNITLFLNKNKLNLILLDKKYNGNMFRMKFKCKICHSIFHMSLSDIINAGHGCSACYKSKGERKIKIFLEENKINYIFQKTFDECVYKRKLKFDFYLPDFNTCIEYNGGQHYSPVDFFGGLEKFKYLNNCMNIKKEYCTKNKILLIEIPYHKFDNIEKILSNYTN